MAKSRNLMLTREAHHGNRAGDNETRRKREIRGEHQNVEEHGSLQSLLPKQQNAAADVPKFLVNAC
jgi:hypothetical protein